MTYEARIVLARPRADVFAFLVDAARLTAWRDGLIAVRREADARGPEARFVETLATPVGRRDVTVGVRADPPRALVFRVLDGPVRPHGILTLRDGGGTTELAYRLDLRPLLPVATPVDRVIFAALRANVERSLANLGAHPEFARPGANGPP